MCFLAAGDCQQSPPNPKIVFEEAQRALNAHDYAKAEQGFREVSESTRTPRQLMPI